MNMIYYLGRRLVLAIFVLLGVVTITFVLAHSLGNPIFAWLGKTALEHPQIVDAYEAKYHLNDPLWIQFYYYVVGLLQGNLGYSPSRGFIPVTTVIAQTLPNTIQIAFFAILTSLGLGITLGVISARYHHRTADKGIRAFYLSGTSSPAYFIALAFLIIFTYAFHIFPSGGSVSQTLSNPKIITSIPMLDALLNGDLTYFVSSLQHVILPAMALAFGAFGIVVRVLRASMLDVMRMDYIRTARAKGLDERTVFFKHGLRNAMISVVTLGTLMVTWMITGTIFVENIFNYPGIGQYVYTCLLAQDYPGILAVTLIFAIIIVAANLAADLLYVVVDPQIRLG